MPTGNEIGWFAVESETLFLQSIELTAGDDGICDRELRADGGRRVGGIDPGGGKSQIEGRLQRETSRIRWPGEDEFTPALPRRQIHWNH